MPETPTVCPECGCVFADIAPASVSGLLAEATRSLGDALRSTAHGRLTVRADTHTWSPLEYACHVRDVLLNLRDRVVLAVVEQVPVFAPLHREERVTLIRYNTEDPADVAEDLAIATRLFGQLFDALEENQLTRRGVYAGTQVDVLWIGRQALHEARHHLQDAQLGIQTTA